MGFLWAWIAVAYHLSFFTSISPAVYVFASISMAGAAVYAWQGVIRRRLQFKWMPSMRAYAGVALPMFALVMYPIWLTYAGQGYPAKPNFGLPCPTTIFPVGLMAIAVPSNSRSPMMAPVLWCFVGAQAVFSLGVQPDFGVVAAAVVGIFLQVSTRQGEKA